MSIELITGIPGNGKTLHTISRLRAKAAAENRPVFYSGIKLTEGGLDWTEIDPVKWADCPPNSLILIDESQKTFRNRSLGTTPPKFVTDLEEHRHRGVDLFLITQHPSLVDPAIRRLTQTHFHLVRIFGMEASTVHRWNGVKDNCEKNESRTDSEKVRWAFDKSVYPLYKSAEVHTMKRSIPFRVKLLMATPVILALLAYGVYSMIQRKMHPENAVVQTAQGPAGAQAQSSPVGAGYVPGVKPVVFDPVADAKQFVAMSTPRVTGLPHTAPKYDELTKPVRVPVPAMCIQTKIKCACSTQQGTPMEVPRSMCVEFARNGFFQDFDADADQKAAHRTERGAVALGANRPDTTMGATAGQVASAQAALDASRSSYASR